MDQVPDMKEKTPIQLYFQGKTVFVTGALGFLGKLLVEKLLRSCYDIKKIYILVRPKKGKEENERLQKEFKKQLFGPLSKLHPNFMDKIQVIPGDLKQPNLGMTSEDIQLLKKEVNCIFHVAATTNFNEKMKPAAMINVQATMDLVKIAKEMEHLESFVHVSTAFAHCTKKDIDEKIYQPKLSSKDLMSVVEALDEQILDSITPHLLGDSPNSYVFTKAVAEEVILTHGGSLPISVVRPAIVCTTYDEPLYGWTDSLFGIIGTVLGAALGAIRTLHGDENNLADIVPADLVVNQIIAACWDAANTSVRDQPKVFNYVSSVQNPCTWKEFMQFARKCGSKYGSQKIIWYHGLFVIRKNIYVHNICLFLLHTVPAQVIDTVLVVIGRKAMAVKLYRKIDKLLSAISYFVLHSWDFSNNNVQTLYKKLSPADQKLFNFDISSIDWETLLDRAVVGGKEYILNEPPDTAQSGRRRLLIAKYVHYIVVSLFMLLVYTILRFIFRIAF